MNKDRLNWVRNLEINEYKFFGREEVMKLLQHTKVGLLKV